MIKAVVPAGDNGLGGFLSNLQIGRPLPSAGVIRIRFTGLVYEDLSADFVVSAPPAV
jgi:hypothetical protein